MNAAFNIQLQGYPPANRDAIVHLRHEATGAVVERKPFLDGSLLIRDLEPGFYELEVRHPNLIEPIDRRRVRLFSQLPPTSIPIRVPPFLFLDTPIQDVPNVDLGPVQQTSVAVRDQLRPIGNQSPGQAIQASDWNTLVNAVSDLANAVLELTNLVSPRGHDHPEIAEKIGEVQGNIRRFAEAFGGSLVELRREIEAENLRRNVEEVLELGEASADVRIQVLGRVEELESAIQSTPPVFTYKLATTGNLLLTTVNELAVAQGAGADQFLANPKVQQLSAMASQYSEAGTQTRPESELMTYQRTTTVADGKFINIVRS